MQTRTKFRLAKIALVLGTIPFLIQAYEYGPDPYRTGAPGDTGSGTCQDSGCHSGVGVNKGGGSIQIILPGAATYTPGVTQHIMVKVTDAAKAKFGFELSARLASNTDKQAGSLATTDALTQVICGDGGTKSNGGSCPAAFPVQFVEHSLAGYTASTAGSYTYQFDWTPPPAGSGKVNLYVAGVAGPAGAPNNNNCDVYDLATPVVLTEAAGSSNAPAITPGGVVPVYSTSTTVQPGSWFSIYGSKLASALAIWNGDFPISLGGTTVKVNGKPAYLWFVSDGQINAQAPDDTATGSVAVDVTTGSGTSSTTITLAKASPSLLLLPDNKHATGIILTPNGKGSQGGGTYDLLGPASLGAGFRAAAKGENIALYAVGLGPTNPAVPAGKIFSSAAPIDLSTITMTIGSVPVPKIDFAGLVGAGLYQINLAVPQNAASGDLPVSVSVNGVATQSNISIPIQ
jgi:uncharacterized protein (TIGR03437 family)